MIIAGRLRKKQYWIGLNDQLNQEGKFVWLDETVKVGFDA